MFITRRYSVYCVNAVLLLRSVVDCNNGSVLQCVSGINLERRITLKHFTNSVQRRHQPGERKETDEQKRRKYFLKSKTELR